MMKSTLSKQLFRRIFGLYLLAAITVTLAQATLEYIHTKEEVSLEMQQVLNTFTPGIIDALWNYDKPVISSILLGMYELHVIDGIQVFDHRGLLIKGVGVTLNIEGKITLDKLNKDDKNPTFTQINSQKTRLTHYSNQSGRKDHIGEIIIYSSNRVVIDRVKYGFILIITNSIIKTVALWFIFLYFINRLLTRPLNDFSSQLSTFNLDNLGDKKLIINAQDNELHSLQNHFNGMMDKIRHSSDELKDSHKKVELINTELAQQKEKLEVRVQQRTQALKNSMEELAKISKIASLSKLLTSMAHELNTPLGIAVTANSYEKELINDLLKNITAENLRKEDLLTFIHSCQESCLLSHDSLQSLTSLIKRFKQLDANQSKSEFQSFSVIECINVCLTDYDADFKNRHIVATINVSPQLTITSDPAIFSKVLTTLINNTLTHGFNNSDAGNIKIEAYTSNDSFILEFQDDGTGINEKIIDRIFDPFSGEMAGVGTGLGLNIMYNLVTLQLDGHASCDKTIKQGAKFTLSWPLGH
jgi:signal transduction histidine kinase